MVRIATVCRDPVEYTDHSLSWQIQIDFNRQCLTVKIINDIEHAKTTTTDQGIMHKIDRPAQVQTPAGLTDTEFERRYQMSNQLTLKGWF